jgi:glycosyltransferase involved in cell wall biosynthesis
MKFSIITCTYNSEIFLGKNTESVLSQSFLDFEHIFIDGFSIDKTVEIIKGYQQRYPGKVKLFQLSPQGISNAMNEGIRRSSGEYLIHLHSDDSFYDSEVLKDVNDFLSTNNFDWIYGKINVIENDGQSVGVFPLRKVFQGKSSQIIKKYIYKFYNYIPHQSVFIKRKVFDDFGGFDEKLSSAMDPDLWFRIINKTNWSFYDRVISNFCLRSGSQSANLKNKEKNMDNLQIVRKRYLSKIENILANVFDYLVGKIKNNYR